MELDGGQLGLRQYRRVRNGQRLRRKQWMHFVLEWTVATNAYRNVPERCGGWYGSRSAAHLE